MNSEYRFYVGAKQTSYLLRPLLVEQMLGEADQTCFAPTPGNWNNPHLLFA
jgi:hypothetical protein